MSSQTQTVGKDFRDEALVQFKLTLKYMYENDKEAFGELRLYIQQLINHDE
jgi:hypothetical protein